MSEILPILIVAIGVVVMAAAGIEFYRSWLLYRQDKEFMRKHREEHWD